MKAGEHKGNQASLWQVVVLLPWAIVDLNSSGWTECPMGCLGAWVHLGTWRIWASLMVPSQSRLLSCHGRAPILRECWAGPGHVCLFGQSLRRAPGMVVPPTRSWLKLCGCLLCWVWIRDLNPGFSCQEWCQEMSFTTHYELLFSQFGFTELQWVTKTAITPTGDNQRRVLLSSWLGQSFGLQELKIQDSCFELGWLEHVSATSLENIFIVGLILRQFRNLL